MCCPAGRGAQAGILQERQALHRQGNWKFPETQQLRSNPNTVVYTDAFMKTLENCKAAAVLLSVTRIWGTPLRPQTGPGWH